jgi:SAM-dependent methyltransferase
MLSWTGPHCAIIDYIAGESGQTSLISRLLVNGTGVIMTGNDATFVGSIPTLYEQYLGPLLFQPYAEDISARVAELKPGKVLETAAGTGIVTRALAQSLPQTVEIVATDLNQAMLDHAATLLQAPNVRWKQADAQALPFEDASFDAVVCQFGVMFFPDKQQGYREAHRVLKPGGRFVFNVWGRLEDNEFSHCVSQAVAALFPDNPPRFLERTPYGYFDPDVITAELQRVGFGRVEIEAVEKVSRAASAREPAIGFCQGTPLRSEIETRDASRLSEVTDTAAETIAARFGPTAVQGRMLAYVMVGYHL